MFQAIGDVGDFAGVVAQIVEYHVRGFRRIPVQVHERLERALVAGLTRVLPVDRSIRIHLHVVVVEIVHEILADAFVQYLFDVGDVRGQILLAECHGKENLRNRVTISSSKQSVSVTGMTLSASGSNDGFGICAW